MGQTDLEAGPQGRRLWRIAAEAAAVYGVIWAYLYYFQFIMPFIPGTDGYYHIKVAWLTRTEGLLRSFPWAAFSLWKEHYFDKDLGFHLLLLPFSFGDLATGAKLAAVTYGAFVFVSFYLVLRLQGLDHAWFWLLLLLAAGGTFGYRVNVPRPQLVSMILALWAGFFVLRRSFWGTLVIAALYALCYTAPILVVGFALVAALAGLVLHGERDWRTPAAAVAGVLLGWLVHPHFPHNFVATWVQLARVLSSAWAGSGPELSLGGELTPLSTRGFLVTHQALYLVAAVLPLALTRLRGRIDRPLVTLYILAHLFFVMTCLSKRFVEYWVPFSLWLGALVAHRLLQSLSLDPPAFWRRRWLRNLLLGAAVLAALALALRTGQSNWRSFSALGPSCAEGAARWLARNTPPGSLVFTCDWDDAPELFFFNHQNRYLVFLDPHFMYSWRPEVWHLWHEVANGRHTDPVSAITGSFGAAYGFCTSSFSGLQAQLERDPRAWIVLRHPSYYVFQLRPGL